MLGLRTLGELAIGESAAGGPPNYTITADAGAYAITGVSATILRTRIVVATAGAYAITGVAASITRSRLITANAGAYTITGQAVTIYRSRLISAAAGAYTITGQTADIVIGGSPIVTSQQTWILIRSFTRRGRF